MPAFIEKLSNILRILPRLPLMLVVGLVFLPFACVLLPCVYLSHRWEEFSLKLKMRRKQRTISMKALAQRIASGQEPGTFIDESYTLGWNVSRIWWTPDTLSTPPDPTTLDSSLEGEPDPVQLGLYNTYADLENGKALLLLARSRRSTPKRDRAT